MRKNWKELRQLAYETQVDRIQSYSLVYMVMLSLIAAFELSMLIRAIFLFDFSNFYHILYFSAYLLLFLASLFTLVLLLLNRNRKRYFPLITKMINVYGGVILLWADTISSVDVARGKTMIVFLTVIMVVAAVLNMHPVLFATFTSVISICLLIQAVHCNAFYITSSGYFINFSVFVLFSIILAFTQRAMAIKTFVANQKLKHLSYYDQLTGVLNRHSLKEYLTTVPPSTLLYFGIIDLDNFKAVNDTFGHDVGDECLKSIAKLLQEHFGYHVYRYGGDEFVIVCNLRESDIKMHINAINNTLDECHPDKNIHVSAGFYCPIGNDESYDDCFKKADKALYEAKATTKRTTVIYK